MKKLFIALMALSMSVTALAGQAAPVAVSAESEQSDYNLLLRINDSKKVYSKTAGIEARVFEILGGDGMNPTRMALTLSTDMYGDSKVFVLDSIMMYQVTRITFLTKDTLVINYNYDSFDFSKDDAGTQIIAKGSVQIKIKRNAQGAVLDIDVVSTTKH